MSRVVEVRPGGAVSGRVQVPGSKYQANRALILAALADGESVLSPVPSNDDIQRVQDGIRALGCAVAAENGVVRVQGLGDPRRFASAQINVNASGTFARFVSALATLGEQPIVIDGSVRMRERPMRDLCMALRALGAKVEGGNDALPLTITGPLQGGECELPGHISSQFLSALLIVAPYAQQDVSIRLTTPLVSRPFVDMTLSLMREAGVEAESSDTFFRVRAGQRYRATHFALEADPCSASYFLAAAALTGGEVTVLGYNLESVQGEAQFPRVLEQMGCLVKRTSEGVSVRGPGLGLRAVDVDMGNMPDVVQTAAILAAFATGVSRFRNIGHLQHKESNRIFDTATELSKMGIKVQAGAEELIVEGGQPHAALIETHHDHRMAMSFAIAGLKIPGMRINEADVVGKSFPQFWSVLQGLGVTLA